MLDLVLEAVCATTVGNTAWPARSGAVKQRHYKVFKSSIVDLEDLGRTLVKYEACGLLGMIVVGALFSPDTVPTPSLSLHASLDGSESPRKTEPVSGHGLVKCIRCILSPRIPA